MFSSHSWADDSDPDSSPSSPMSKRNLKPAPDPSYPVVQQHPDPIPTGVGGPFPEPPHPQQVAFAPLPPPPASPSSGRKRKAPGPSTVPNMVATSAPDVTNESGEAVSSSPATKKSRTNTPWSPAEEQRLKTMRDAGSSWSEIAKTFPTRTEGSVKKHWYKDMHYAEFAEDESAALLSAIKEYEASKWKVIGQKVGKPAKACEQYAKEHFGGKT